MYFFYSVRKKEHKRKVEKTFQKHPVWLVTKKTPNALSLFRDQPTWYVGMLRSPHPKLATRARIRVAQFRFSLLYRLESMVTVKLSATL